MCVVEGESSCKLGPAVRDMDETGVVASPSEEVPACKASIGRLGRGFRTLPARSMAAWLLFVPALPMLSLSELVAGGDGRESFARRCAGLRIVFEKLRSPKEAVEYLAVAYCALSLLAVFTAARAGDASAGSSAPLSLESVSAPRELKLLPLLLLAAVVTESFRVSGFGFIDGRMALPELPERP